MSITTTDSHDTTPAVAPGGAEHLEDGWSAGTPAGDTIVLDATRAMVAAYDALAIANGGWTARSDDLVLAMTDVSAPTPFANQAHLARPLRSHDAGHLARDLGEFYGSRPGGPFLLFAASPTPDLTPHGLHLAGHPPLMVRWAPVNAAPVDGLDVREALDEAGLADFEHALVEGYPIPELQPWNAGGFLKPAVLQSGWRFLVGYHEDRPVATAAMFAAENVVLVEMVSTRAECRGRGYGALMTCCASGEDPERVAVLLASDPGRPVYERLGFRAVSRFTLWVGAR